MIDSAYLNTVGYLTLYMKSEFCYHLKGFIDCKSPNGKKENFNYYYTPLRLTIERMFDILKNTWKILKDRKSQVSRQMQIDIIMSHCALHNFSQIRERISILS